MDFQDLHEGGMEAAEAAATAVVAVALLSMDAVARLAVVAGDLLYLAEVPIIRIGGGKSIIGHLHDAEAKVLQVSHLTYHIGIV